MGVGPGQAAGEIGQSLGPAPSLSRSLVSCFLSPLQALLLGGPPS